jgi:CheY-like chemotaxis protein
VTKILLVDDSPLILKVAEAFLKGQYHVVTAVSGKEALLKAACEKPGLILMDQNMPGWTGVETKSALGREDRTREIPVVIMTTECQVEELAPGVDHLVKPFNAAQLQNKLSQYL